MRRAVVALGTAALLALVLVGGHHAGRAPARGLCESAPAVLAAGVADASNETGAAATPDAESSWSRATLRPGEVALRVLDVATHAPVPNLEVALAPPGSEEARRTRTDENGVAAWEALPPGSLHVRIPDDGYGTVAYTSITLCSERPSLPVTVWVERMTTLRLRFAHDDGTPVGAVIDEVTGEENFSETTSHGMDVLACHDWTVRTGSAVEVWALCEDGYEAETALTCEGWPVDERTIYLKPAAPRGRSRVRLEVVAEETLEPIADAGVDYFYNFVGRRHGGFRYWEGATDKDGIAVFDNLPTAGIGFVSAWARGRREMTETLTLEPGSPRILRFALPLRSRPGIRGTCTGRPHARIQLAQGNRIRNTELSEGEFAYDDLEPGVYTLTAIDGDDMVSVTASPGGPPLLLSFPPLGTLVLDCRDALGHVPGSIDVVLEREGSRGRRNDLVAENGRFRLTLSQGPVRIAVAAPGYRTTPSLPVHVVGDAVNEATVPLGYPLPILDVLVVDPRGEPIPGVDVSIRQAARSAPAPSGDTTSEFTEWLALRATLETPNTTLSERTSLDGWARFQPDIDEPEEVEVAIGRGFFPDTSIGDPAPNPFLRSVQVPVTGRVTATFVVVPRPVVRGKGEEPPPAPLLDRDLLLEWDGWPLRLDKEVPLRWTEPVAIKVLRDGKELDLTLLPMTREFLVHQALVPPP